jgi:hypothetical protein
MASSSDIFLQNLDTLEPKIDGSLTSAWLYFQEWGGTAGGEGGTTHA